MSAPPPTAGPPTARDAGRLPLVALIISIAAAVAAVAIPVLGVPAGIAGAICGVVALAREPQPGAARTRAIVAIVVGLLAAVVGVLVFVLLLNLVRSVLP